MAADDRSTMAVAPCPHEEDAHPLASLSCPACQREIRGLDDLDDAPTATARFDGVCPACWREVAAGETVLTLVDDRWVCCP